MSANVFQRMVVIAAVFMSAIIPLSAAADVGMPAPEIAASRWLNSTPKSIAELKGRVALIHFWTFGCYNCRNVEPHVKEWHRQYAERGLTVIGVHTPETAYERDVANVERYLHDHDIQYPIAIDGDFTTWKRYATTAWPTWYLIDKRGILRHVHVGEGAYAETEHEIQSLLSED